MFKHWFVFVNSIVWFINMKMSYNLCTIYCNISTNLYTIFGYAHIQTKSSSSLVLASIFGVTNPIAVTILSGKWLLLYIFYKYTMLLNIPPKKLWCHIWVSWWPCNWPCSSDPPIWKSNVYGCMDSMAIMRFSKSKV